MSQFLNENKPIHSCSEMSCQDCDVKNAVNCHFNKRQLTTFLLFSLPIMLLGSFGAYVYSIWAVVVQWMLYFVYFGFIEIRTMCSHCPHYGEPSIKSLKCWANYGAPKLWKYRPGPMSYWEKFVFLMGMATIVLFPLVMTILAASYIIAGVYFAVVIFGYIMLETHLCNHCFNFACPLNRVKRDIRRKFRSKNPSIKDAWDKKNIE